MLHLKLVKQEIEAEKSASVEAWVISVKFKKGCYRHIQIPKTKTLAELADVILWSFDFVNDHAHAFFMDNVEWSHADSYFLSFVSDDVEERYTENVYLDSLSVKQKFKFIFDFGDEWRFEC
ncbi:Plasmid pRiA4b ORF-3-like protein [Streptococcus pneumoniae]|nr:Plasmid pRiA4b ORF-3-like protein [Streptococcus pneumoniae]